MDKRAKYTYDYTFFDNIDSEAKAYFLGLITADGYVVEGPRRYVVNLGSTDKDLPYKLREAVQGTMPVYEILPDKKKRWQTEWRLSICSKYMVSRLVELGIRQRKSLRETFCDAIPETLWRHYIRGVFDGDGTLGMYGYKHGPQPRIGLVGSQQLLTTIRDLFTKILDIPSVVVSEKQNNLYRLQYSGNHIARRIIEWLYSDVAVAMNRKARIAQMTLNTPEAHQWTTTIHGKPAPIQYVPCDACGTILSRRPRDVRHHVFCDHLCQGQFLRQQTGEGQIPMPSGDIALVVASPPYAQGLGKGHTYADHAKREKDSHRRIMTEKSIADPYYGSSMGNLGNLPVGLLPEAPS